MDSREVLEWNASMRLDPEESDKADIRHALAMDLMTKLLLPRRRGQGQKPPTAVEFLAALPWREEHVPSRPQTPKELQAKIDAAMRMLGGRKS